MEDSAAAPSPSATTSAHWALSPACSRETEGRARAQRVERWRLEGSMLQGTSQVILKDFHKTLKTSIFPSCKRLNIHHFQNKSRHDTHVPNTEHQNIQL